MTARRWKCVFTLPALVVCLVTTAEAATTLVGAGGNLQAALDAAQPGDIILLAEGSEFVGNFVLPAKSGDAWITLRSSAPDTVLPPPGVRISPAYAPRLARLRSPNGSAVLRTAAGAHHWRLQYLDFPANANGLGDLLQIGDGSSTQNALALVPHHFELRHLYMHGSPTDGQKRGIALNAASVTIADSYIAECKAIGQDSQAIGGWNGPGPYVIENNYLEASGENVLFGGADPAIAGLVADGITFRRNYLSRPMAWRDPILATPVGVTATAEPGGALAAGTYGYRIVARRYAGSTLVRSASSIEATVTAAAGSALRVRWQPVTGAAEYRVYGRTPGGENMYWRVTAPELVDTGADGTAEAVPTSAGTLWSVKNIFELKNARNVLIQSNILENHWKESQPGYAIVFTPRNSNGACTWCVVEHVRMEGNLIRNVAAGVNITGYDVATRPTQQSNDIVIRGNLFAGMNTSLGGNAWFMLIGDAPRDVTVEHNTIDSNGTTVVSAYGGTSADPREIYGFRMVANASRHGTYGINGSFFSYGNGILNGFFPGAVFTGNYLSGGSAARYPAGNLFAGTFPEQFVAPTTGNFTLSTASILRHAAPDGTDIGVDYTALAGAIAGVDTGVSPALPQTLRPPTADFAATCTFLDCTFADASAPGSGALTGWSWNFGDGALGAGAPAAHHFATAGTYTVSETVTDTNGLTGSRSRQVAVSAPVPPVASLSVTCTYLSCVFADTSTPGSGTITGQSWTFGDGSSATGTNGTHAYATSGTFTIVLTVTDTQGQASSASRTVTVEPPNVPPTAAFSTSCTDLVCTFMDVSTDVDGRIASEDWTIAGAPSTGGTTIATFPAPGTYTVSLHVLDDDGAAADATAEVTVTGLVHVGLVNGVTKRWNSTTTAGTFYWSADVTLAVHGANERLVAGATITAAWSGALTKTVTCVTNASGVCTFKSGTLSMLRTWVTLTVIDVAAPSSAYGPSANHGLVGNAAGTAVRYLQP